MWIIVRFSRDDLSVNDQSASVISMFAGVMSLMVTIASLIVAVLPHVRQCSNLSAAGSSDSKEQFARDLRCLRVSAGSLSLRKIRAELQKRDAKLAKCTGAILNGSCWPTWEFVKAFHEICVRFALKEGGQLPDFQKDRKSWQSRYAALSVSTRPANRRFKQIIVVTGFLLLVIEAALILPVRTPPPRWAGDVGYHYTKSRNARPQKDGTAGFVDSRTDTCTEPDYYRSHATRKNFDSSRTNVRSEYLVLPSHTCRSSQRLEP